MIATLKDLAKVLVAKHQLKQRDAEIFINAVVDTILEGLQADRIVKIKGFGTFKLTAVRDRESVNVNTGERIVVSGHDKISFTPDSVMRDMVNKPFAHFDTVVLADDVSFDDVVEGYVESEADIDGETEQEIKPIQEQDIEPNQECETVVEPILTADLIMNDEIENQNAIEKPIVEEPVVEEPVVEEPVVEETVAEETAEEESVVEEPSAIEPAEEESEDEESSAIEPAEEESEDEEPSAIEPAEEEPIDKDKARDERIKINGFYVPTEEDEAEDNKNECKKIFILYAIIANILIAAIAFVLGYLCCSNNWLSFEPKTVLVPEQEPAEVLEDSAAMAEMAKIDSIRKAAVGPGVNKGTENNAQKVEAEKKAAEKKEAEKKEAEKREAEKKAAEQKKAAEKKAAEQSAANAKQSPSETVNVGATTSGIPDQTPYQKNVRVRTGAYYIVGTQATITVREGQTLQSISKRYLGEGMECYVEVYNGGLKSVSEGQTIKIPKLQLKKKQNK